MVSPDLSSLPNDVAALKQMLLQQLAHSAAQDSALSEARQALSESRSAVSEQNIMLAEQRRQIEILNLLIARFKRKMFGRSSEKADPEQLLLGIEDVQQAIAHSQEAQAAAEQKRTGRAPRREANLNRGHLPTNLPEIEVVVDIENKTCSCCGGDLHVIGEDVSRMIDIVPIQLRIKNIRRPRYGCRGCSEGVVQAPAPERPITGGMATEALLAHILISKYADHCPLHRQSEIFARHGLQLDRSTMASWVGRICWWLEPLYELLCSRILSYPRVFADDTPIPVLDPGRGRTKTGRLWAYAIDDRPWNGPAPPAVAYIYSEDRKRHHPESHLRGYNGIVQVDGYTGYYRLKTRIARCWVHWRREFYDVDKKQASPLAKEAIRRIGELYAIEADIRGQSADERRDARQERSKPLIIEFKNWCETRLTEISAASDMAKAIRYGLGDWAQFTAFLDDGRIELDNNTVERSIRPIKLGKKNHLFAGSDSGGRHWAIAASLIQSAKLCDIDPFAYIKDILERMVSGDVKSTELEQLLPWTWVERQSTSKAAA